MARKVSHRRLPTAPLQRASAAPSSPATLSRSASNRGLATLFRMANAKTQPSAVTDVGGDEIVDAGPIAGAPLPEGGIAEEQVVTDVVCPEAGLSYSLVEQYQKECGEFVQSINWIINNGRSDTNGFIVQQVNIDQAVASCDGRDLSFKKTYWEAWPIVEGRIASVWGWLFGGAGNDSFGSLPTGNAKGTKREDGYAKFMPGYMEPRGWHDFVPEAGDLAATTTQPPGWDTSGTVHRGMAVDFNCCQDQK